MKWLHFKYILNVFKLLYVVLMQYIDMHLFKLNVKFYVFGNIFFMWYRPKIDSKNQINEHFYLTLFN